jgi:iron complex outermembrane receptor protein
VQLRHAPLGPLQGVVGLQSENLRFSAWAQRPFVPGTRTQSNALFVLEELSLGATVLSAGARTERVKVRPKVTRPMPTSRASAPASRRFTPLSLSLGATHDLGAGWQAQATLGSTERAPAYYELYANGVHVATAAYERGDPNLALERSRHVEAGLAWRSGAHTFKASVFSTHFMRYIAWRPPAWMCGYPVKTASPTAACPSTLSAVCVPA